MHQHGSKYFALCSQTHYPSPTLGMASVGQNTFFKNMDMLHIKLKKITNAATWYQIFCAQTPIPLTLRMGSVGQNSPLSEHGHVAYQIKENHECSNMVRNILLTDSPTLGMGPIGQNLPFSEHGHIEYQFKGNQKMQQQGSKYLPEMPTPSPRPWGWGQ